jgi:hypothetical protein
VVASRCEPGLASVSVSSFSPSRCERGRGVILAAGEHSHEQIIEGEQRGRATGACSPGHRAGERWDKGGGHGAGSFLTLKKYVSGLPAARTGNLVRLAQGRESRVGALRHLPL